MIPSGFKPMEPIPARSFPAFKNWIYQIKWDGIRLITQIAGGTLQAFTKHRNLRTHTYPELQVLTGLLPDGTILDGEMIAIDPVRNKPDFSRILLRDRIQNPLRIQEAMRHYPACYMIFDVLCLNGQYLLDKPWRERNEILQSLHFGSFPVSIYDSYEDGRRLWELIREKQWEGIVAKNPNSPYLFGKKHRDWYKFKTAQTGRFAVAGWIEKEGVPVSLVLGRFVQGELKYAGRVALAAALPEKRLLQKEIRVLERENPPFVDKDTWDQPVRWLFPILIAEVEYLEWTPEGALRHPRFVRLVPPNESEIQAFEEWSR